GGDGGEAAAEDGGEDGDVDVGCDVACWCGRRQVAGD
ncbi:hypothetical protein Tco_0665766, partial [Tanacetum coccineum]